MTKSKPNVIPEAAAEVAIQFIFEQRGTESFEPRDMVARMLAEGHGGEFPTEVRKKRLRTWSMQVLKRLRKRGWIDEAGEGRWAPTDALRNCSERRALSKNVPRGPGPASVAQRRAPPPPKPRFPVPEIWRDIIEEWIFRHRRADFGVAEVAVAVVQRGFGEGDISVRLDGAREIVEQTLDNLEYAGLLEFDHHSELWMPTEQLRTWPAAGDDWD